MVLWAAVACVAFVGAGCGSGPASSGPGSTTTSGAAGGRGDATTSAGCGRTAQPGTTTLSPVVAGRTRVVVVHVPAGYRATAAVPLVLDMHGSGSTAEGQEVFSGMDATADADGFIVAYPQALIPDGAGFDWNVPGVPLIGGRSVPPGAADDVSFLVDLVGILQQRFCVDPRRIYATGFSGGARMASQLACDGSGVFAAVAPVSGLRAPTPCPATRAVPIVAFHGTADPVDPFEGHGQTYWTYSVPQAAADWGARDRCGPAASSAPAAGVTLTTYSDCSGGATVELYAISGEGHEWPGGPHMPRALTSVLGPQTTSIDADDIIWAFFSAHPLSAS